MNFFDFFFALAPKHLLNFRALSGDELIGSFPTQSFPPTLGVPPLAVRTAVWEEINSQCANQFDDDITYIVIDHKGSETAD